MENLGLTSIKNFISEEKEMEIISKIKETDGIKDYKSEMKMVLK